MKINKETLKEIDREMMMIPLTFDVMFKSVFSKNMEILKEFLVEVLKLKYELEELDIRLLNNELPSENMNEYVKRVDVNIVLNDDIYVEIEINRENFNLVKYRNKMYEDKLSSMLLERGENIQRLESITFYQLNLNTENRSESSGEAIIVPFDITNNKVYMNNRKTVLKYLEFYYRLYYNEPNKRTKDVIWLASLSAKTYLELYTILSKVLDKKSLKKFMKDVINMSWEDFNLHEWEREKLDEYVQYKREQGYLEKEQALSKKEETLTEKEETLTEKEETLTEKEETLTEKEETLTEKEETLTEKEEALSEKEQDLITKEQDLITKEQGLIAKEQGLFEKEQIAENRGLKQGIENTIKGMLENNIEIDIITKITNKSYDEIKRIKDSMNN